MLALDLEDNHLLSVQEAQIHPESNSSNMPVPWEAVLPMGLVVVLFGVTGSGFSLAKRLTNDGKPQRWGLDDWDRMMIQRDERLTGKFRAQAANAEAPPEFSVNSAWSTERVRAG